MGPGSTVGPWIARLLAPLTWVGQLSALAAAASALWMAWTLPLPLHDMSPAVLAQDLGTVAMILLPAALELGAPGVAVRNRPLLAGVALLAGADVAGVLLTSLDRWLPDVLFALPPDATSDPQGIDSQTGVLLATSWFAIARLIVAAGGWSRVSSGLSALGAETSRRVLVGAAVVAAVLQLIVTSQFATLGGLDAPGWQLVLATNLVAALVGAALTGLIAAVIVGLLAGASLQLQPRIAWRLAGAAAAAFAVGLAGPVMFVALAVTGGDPSGNNLLLIVGLHASGVIGPVLLLAACLAGLGRVTAVRPAMRAGRTPFVVRGGRLLLPGPSGSA